MNNIHLSRLSWNVQELVTDTDKFSNERKELR
jgi:hypothetical protein